MHKKSYFESFRFGRTRLQHFSCVLVKETLPTYGEYCNKGANARKALVLNQANHNDSKVGRVVQR